jgi:5-formyltetrahydrofolate cyclo-ligase
MTTLLNGLDERWIRAASRRVCRQISDFIQSRGDIEHVLAYVNHFFGEIDLSWLISEILPTQSVYLPRVIGGDQLQFLQITQDSKLTPGMFGINEPPKGVGAEFDPSNSGTCLVIVPGLAFDRDGRRLGRGKSFYDRFLMRSSMLSAYKLGVCWSLQIVERVPVDEWDVSMECIITEEELIEV